MTSLLEIGTHLVVARRARGLSQRELGQRVGVHQQQIARWEASEYRNTDLEKVDSVAKVLGLNASSSPLLAAEAQAAYGTLVESAVAPVRDLGEIAARIRAHGTEFRDTYKMKRIGVFGSFVSGEQTAESDVDLLVEFEVRPQGFAYFAPAEFLEDIFGRKVDMVEEKFLRDRMRPRVLKEAVYVWEA